MPERRFRLALPRCRRYATVRRRYDAATMPPPPMMRRQAFAIRDAMMRYGGMPRCRAR